METKELRELRKEWKKQQKEYELWLLYHGRY